MALKDLVATATEPKGILMSIEGPQKTGKTEFGLSMPGDIFILNLNWGLVGVYEKHIGAGKILYVQDIQIPWTKELPGQAPFTVLQQAAADCWRKAISSTMEAVKAPEVRNIFIDTGSELWDLLRIARLGKLTQVMPTQYAAVNAEFRQLLQAFLASGKNVILSHKVKPEYVNNERTAKFERAGFGDVGFDVQVELRSDRDLKKIGEEQYSLTFMDCRANPQLAGQVLTGKDCNFLKVATLIYPKTTEETWK